jgi:hypothetical protein
MTWTRPDSSAGGAPPAMAQHLLTWIVPVASHDSVPGDLLEEYRESVRPSRGKSRADLWYVRQVAGFLWRLSWMFALLTAVAVVLRTVVDTLAAPAPGPHAYQFRSTLSTYSAIGTFLLAGLYGGYHTGRTRAGVLTAVAASIIGNALALGFDIVFFFAAIQHDPARLNLFYLTGGWGEEFGLPIMITAIAGFLGLIGGTCGKLAGRIPKGRLAA